MKYILRSNVSGDRIEFSEDLEKLKQEVDNAGVWVKLESGYKSYRLYIEDEGKHVVYPTDDMHYDK